MTFGKKRAEYFDQWYANMAAAPPHEDIASRDIGTTLHDSGFTDVAVTEMPAWRAPELAHWQAAVAIDPAGDPALESLYEEGLRALSRMDRIRRVLAVGRVPDSPKHPVGAEYYVRAARVASRTRGPGADHLRGFAPITTSDQHRDPGIRPQLS
jgi:hypothetical protein